MPRIVDYPDGLRPYTFHGVTFSTWKEGDEQATADECPFCDREGKFGVEVETTKWKCFRCSESGNSLDFIRKLLDESDKATTDYSEMVESRGISEETLMQWGVCRSILTDDWLVPAYSAKSNVTQAYRYMKTMKGMRLLPTPTLGASLFGVYQYDSEAEQVFICEGPWDGLALWEALGQTKATDDGLKRTASKEASILAYSSVLAVPGAGTFSEAWSKLLVDKSVFILFDNDYKRKGRDGKTIQPAGFTATKRLVRLLRGLKDEPHEIRYLRWGEGGYDPELKHGYDVRDAITGSKTRQEGLGIIFSRTEEAPKEWKGKSKSKQNTLKPRRCGEYKVVKNAWKKALKWTPGLDHALTVMLAAIASTKSVGDQLWIKVIGPASCGKSTLCEAISVSTRHVLAKSTIRGFHSGFRSDGGEDHSLVSQLYDKTLVTKDGDTLLQSPNLSQILSEARDLYDSTSRTHYRNAMSKDYQGVRMTWLLCGTSSLRSIDQSELGERFLDCVIMESIEDKLEDIVAMRKARKAVEDLAMESDGMAESQYDPALAEAMALTGGYVDWLRDNAGNELGKIENSEEALLQCARLGKFVAHMRARPSDRQEENAEREFSARLVSQLVRLANCLAFVLNRDSVDDVVLEQVKRVALDTSRGQTLAITDYLYEVGDTHLKSLSIAVKRTESKLRPLLQFLRQIGVVESYTPEEQRRMHWRLTPRMTLLYQEALGLE